MPKILWIALLGAGGYFLYTRSKSSTPASPAIVNPVGTVEGDQKRAVVRGKTYTPGAGSISPNWSLASRVKNIARNTTGKGARINLDQSVTLFGSK